MELNWHPAIDDEVCMDCKDELEFYVQAPTSDALICDVVCLSCSLRRSIAEVA